MAPLPPPPTPDAGCDLRRLCRGRRRRFPRPPRRLDHRQGVPPGALVRLPLGDPRGFTGRMLRLFDTGRREEDRLVRDLRRTGATVLDADPETGRQWQVAGARRPLRRLARRGRDRPARGAEDLARRRVQDPRHEVVRRLEARRRRSGPSREHWAQMQVYMHLTGIARAMYVAVGKDTDEIHVERIAPILPRAERLIARRRAHDRRAAAAGADLRRSNVVAVPAVRAPRHLPRRSAGRTHCRTCLH